MLIVLSVSYRKLSPDTISVSVLSADYFFENSCLMFVWFIFVSRLILRILKNFAVSWLLCGKSRRWIDVCFQPWCYPFWLTRCRRPTNKLSTPHLRFKVPAVCVPVSLCLPAYLSACLPASLPLSVCLSVYVWGGSKGGISFPLIFYAMRSLVPVGHSWDISGHLFTWLVCLSFQWRHGLLFTDYIVWDDKDKAIGFKRSHRIHLGAGSPKLQLSQHARVTNYRLISSSAYFPWNMTLKYKMKLSEGSWDKILPSKLKTQCSWKEEILFLAVCLSEPETKVPGVIFASSL